MTHNTYAEQWKEMRDLRRRLVLYFLIGPIGFALNHFFIDPTNRATTGLKIFTFVWLSFGVLAAVQFSNVRCPRCGKPWRGDRLHRIGGPWSLFLGRRCPNCGLEMGT
jgi:hypothetical protein